ncbi:hypothetical protein J132_01813 [Termitomyces sp. J132]|nr:hypothetical protein C0989_010686 [Termitomyces sp. Mn162]KAH0589042.1 hypothetical protein H2248_004815 [Termitomyces sp. 'cryptogamus']KNZ72821.1 hypothetical protein J132_01813 [Termitomyces sp. J132]
MLPLIHYTQTFVSSVVSYVLQVYQTTQSSTAIATITTTTINVWERITMTLDDIADQVEAIFARLVNPGQALQPRLPVINRSAPGPRSHANLHDYSKVIQMLMDLVYAQSEREYLAQERQERRDTQLVGQLRLQNVLLIVLLLAVTFAIIKICRRSETSRPAPRVSRRQRRNPTLADTQSSWRQHAEPAPVADTQTSTRSWIKTFTSLFRDDQSVNRVEAGDHSGAVQNGSVATGLNGRETRDGIYIPPARRRASAPQ